jgi:tetratricopeptide (TPR) repeat protein
MKSSPREKKPPELVNAEQFLSENKYVEAIQELKKLSKRENLPSNLGTSSQFIQGRLLIWLGRYEESLTIFEQVYKENLGAEKNLQTVNILCMMALLYNFLGRFERAREIIKQSDELFKTFNEINSIDHTTCKAFLNYVKGFLMTQYDVNRGLEYLEYSVSLWEKLYPKGSREIVGLDLVKQTELALYPITIMCIGMAMNLIGDLDQAIKYFNQGLAISEEINNKYGNALLLHRLGFSHHSKGEVNQALNYFKNSLKIFKEIENNTASAMVFNSIGALMGEKGDYDLALKNLEKSLNIYEEIRLPSWKLDSLGTAIEISLKIDDLEQAQQYFEQFKQVTKHLKDDNIVSWQNLLEAMILKKSTRTRNKAKAEGIFKAIIEKEGIHPPSWHHIPSFGSYMTALIHLCDLLLMELRATNDLEVLNELEQYVTQLLDIAEKSNSYLILCESYLLQAKISLLTFDFKKAQRYLTQAQQIAERNSLIQLATRITKENEELLTKLDIWENLKDSGAQMADRLKLARIDEHIIGLIQNQSILTSKVSVDEITIHEQKKICLVCRSEVLKFSYICKCGAIYCENCARALSNLENVCWVCESQIDTHKPIKPFKDEEVARIEEK